MLKKAILLCLAIGIAAVTMAQIQKQQIFKLPKSIPKPCWVDKIDWEHPNIFSINAAIQACEEKEEKEERKEKKEYLSKKNEKEKEMDEEPYKVAYIRWLNQNHDFIMADGTVKIDETARQQKIQTAIANQQTNPLRSFASQKGAVVSTGTAAWSVLGPKMTYAGGGVIENSQANIFEVAVAPSDNNILYAGADVGVIFRSIDKGQNWVSISDALPDAEVDAIAVLPSDANTVYCYSGALIKTTNAGGLWSVLNSYTGGRANKIVINPVSGRILVAGQTGIYYSDNQGSSWAKATTNVAPGTEIYDVALNPANPSIVYAVSASGATNHPMIMYRSTNGGANFNAVSLPANTLCEGARMGVTPANSNYIYCITQQDDFPKMLKSTDAGLTWAVSATFTGSGLAGDDVVNGMANGQGYYDLSIMVSVTNADHVIAGTTCAWKSTDGGNNFYAIGGYFGNISMHPDMQCMVAIGSDAYIANDGGIEYSTDFFTDPSNCSARHNGLTATDYWGFDQGWSEDIVVGGRYHNGNAALFDEYGEGNSFTLGGGESPTGHVLHAPGKSRIVAFDDIGTKIIPATLNGSSINAPNSNHLWPSSDGYGFFSSKLMIDPRYANVFWVGKDNSLWKSENYGQSYNEIKNFGSAIWRFDITRTNPDVIYACTTNGIYKTTNNGSSWVQLTLPAGVPWSYYNSDIVVNPANENEVWLCMANASPANKVFRSTNGGSSWVNYTGALLNNKKIAFLAPQGGTNSGVYAITNTSPAKVYYRDAAMADWIDYSDGLPNNFYARQGGIIFYRDNKLRITGNRGTWESPLYSTGAPLAQPMADKKFVNCSKDTVTFGDYSMLQYQGATWQWSFPGAGYVSSLTAREPKVTYPGPGVYDVTLTVTDDQNRVSTKTVTGMIVFTEDRCRPDTVIGKSLLVTTPHTDYNIGTANINSNTFSISCWIKPNGKQKSFSQLIAHDAYPGSTYGFGLGFAFNGYADNLKLCYTDNLVGYGNSSTQIADSTKWNYVVLTYSPTGVIIYLNGVPKTVKSGAMPVIDLSISPFYINRDIHGQGVDYNGQIDEVKIYNYTLSQNEVREKMHLIQSNPLEEAGLLKYLQFNTFDQDNNGVYELVKGSPVSLPSASSLVTSTAPVATGTSYRIPNVNAAGQYDFTGTGMQLTWPTGGTYPNGEVVGFRLNALPGSLPNSNIPVPAKGYFILNNYGTNSTFTPLQKITFNNLTVSYSSYNLTDFNLFKRPSTAYDSLAWGTSLGNPSVFNYGAGGTSKLEFANGNINSFSQFIIESRPLSLPVTLISFNAVGRQNDIRTSWNVSNEDLSRYELERGINATTFTHIKTIPARNNPQSSAYSFDDSNVQPGILYFYRLKMIDKDGTQNFSPVRKAMIGRRATNIISFYPNPVKDWGYIKIASLLNEHKVTINLYDANGRIVYTAIETLHTGENNIMLHLASLAAGTYILKLFDDNGQAGEIKLTRKS